MSEYPVTREEWRQYIEGLSGEELRNKAIAANTLTFVTGLLEEGISSDDVSFILMAFAVRFVADGQVVPQGMPGEYCNMAAVLRALNVPMQA